MLIAIDHGNFAIKTVNHSFVAGLAEHTVKPPLTDEVLEFGSKFWTLSGKRLNYMKDKTNDERYFNSDTHRNRKRTGIRRQKCTVRAGSVGSRFAA